jgi:hypothetical protein
VSEYPYEAVYDHVDRYSCEVELGQTDTEIWRVVVICSDKPEKSGTGMGRSVLDAYRNLSDKLGLGKAPA